MSEGSVRVPKDPRTGKFTTEPRPAGRIQHRQRESQKDAEYKAAWDDVNHWLNEDSQGFRIPATQWGNDLLSALRWVVEVAKPATPTPARSAYLKPLFGDPVAVWHRWFAWRPVETADRGWRWMTFVWRRRVQLHQYLSGGADQWWQYAAALESSDSSSTGGQP